MDGTFRRIEAALRTEKLCLDNTLQKNAFLAVRHQPGLCEFARGRAVNRQREAIEHPLRPVLVRPIVFGGIDNAAAIALAGERAGLAFDERGVNLGVRSAYGGADSRRACADDQ